MSIFHFHEKSFASYDEFVDSKRFSRLLSTDLPLRSCLCDASNSRYRRSKFPYCNTAWRLYSKTTSSEWWTMCLKGTRIYSVWLWRRGGGGDRGRRRDLGSDFNRSYLENDKSWTYHYGTL